MASANSDPGDGDLLNDLWSEEESRKPNDSSNPCLLFPTKDQSDVFRYKGEKKPFPFGIDIKQPQQPRPESLWSPAPLANAPHLENLRPRTFRDCNCNQNCSYNRESLVGPERSVENMDKYLAARDQRCAHRRAGLNNGPETEESCLAIQKILGIAPTPNVQIKNVQCQKEIYKDSDCERKESKLLWDILTTIWNIIILPWGYWLEAMLPLAENVPNHPAEPGKEVFGHPDGPETDVQDAVFVSLDFEYRKGSRKQGTAIITEVGVSTFDTRAIMHRIVRPENVVSTKHFKFPERSRAFNFGHSELTTAAWIPQYIRRLFWPDDDPDSEWKDRKIVLVGHGIRNEISLLNKMGIDLSLSQAIVRVFDTQLLAREVMGPHVDGRLCDVVRGCGIRGVNFHNAGNDANYALRSMILLVMMNCKNAPLTKAQRERVAFYKKMCADQ